MQIVNSILQYKLVMKTCPALPRSLLSTVLGSQFSIQDLAEARLDLKKARTSFHQWVVNKM
jgi:hypothetical protein